MPSPVDLNGALTLKKVVKPSYGHMAKSIGRSKKSYIKIMNNIFDEIKHTIDGKENVMIDLADFGKFQALKKRKVHASHDEKEASGLRGKNDESYLKESI